MGYDQDKKEEAERVADKQYNRNRQQQADLREQQNHDVTLQGNQIKLDEKNKEILDENSFILIDLEENIKKINDNINSLKLEQKDNRNKIR